MLNTEILEMLLLIDTPSNIEKLYINSEYIKNNSVNIIQVTGFIYIQHKIEFIRITEKNNKIFFIYLF